uniref:Uncharacterized protein AlNc14C355G10951 n=1 Tax=Albugo laibachii Nc14 TaxID=890382 RepID=F0WXK0_9STRA|nr:conserved hypothetical protein [Albugo laibachii Nc14]|eukprot:CCA26194.1 conserved hypothetical protein [Albugo laibachii Nc14]
MKYKRENVTNLWNCPNDEPIFITDTPDQQIENGHAAFETYKGSSDQKNGTSEKKRLSQQAGHSTIAEGKYVVAQHGILDLRDDANHEEDPSYHTEENLQRVQNMLNAYQQRRTVVCDNLKEYLASLTTKKDDLGETLIHFPGNFDRIVSLMNEADIRDGAQIESSNSRTASWSQLLIERALNKQYATDDNNYEEMSLETKIALKTARIRQLDAILEVKWGKNLYSDVHKTIEDAHNEEKIAIVEPTLGNDKRASAKRRPSKNRVTFRLDGTKKVNYIERNRDLIRNGSTKYTRDEEERLDHLLSEESVVQEADCSSVVDSNAFALDRHEKNAIEQLIHHRAGIYQPILLDEDSIITIPDDSDDEGRKASLIHYTQNVIQNKKKERLIKQRLDQIDQDLLLLKDLEHTGIVIASDDEDDEGPVSENHPQIVQHHRADDDSSSLHSFRTTSHASVASSCRSVLSRKEFQKFVRSQLHDATSESDSIASRDHGGMALRAQNDASGLVL